MADDRPQAPVLDLDFTRVGDLLTRLPAIAAMMRHTSIQSTLGYICGDPEGPEAAFIRDVLTRPVAEVVERWYGGHLYATTLAVGMTVAALQPDGIPNLSSAP